MMRILPTFAAAAFLLAATAAFAAEPSVEAARAEAQTPAPADSAAASETAPAPEQLSPEDALLVKGYKPVQRGDKTVYCRGEREPDTRMKETRCYSLNQLRNAKKKD